MSELTVAGAADQDLQLREAASHGAEGLERRLTIADDSDLLSQPRSSLGGTAPRAGAIEPRHPGRRNPAAPPPQPAAVA